MKLHGNESKLTINQHIYRHKIYLGGAYFYHMVCDFLLETVAHTRMNEDHFLVCHLGVLFLAAYVFLHAPKKRNSQNY